MEKIKLNLDELKVDSFEITKSNQEKGTIKGFFDTETNYITCVGPTCDPCDVTLVTCEVTCLNTCDATCNPNVGTCCIHC